MTATDRVTTWRRFGGAVHASITGYYTFCGYAIRLDTYARESVTGDQGDQRARVTCRHCRAQLRELGR